MPDMGDPKRLALDLVQAGAQRHVEIIEHHFAEIVGVMTFRHHHAGECGRIRVWILALGFQSPRLHRRARRRAEALVPDDAPSNRQLIPLLLDLYIIFLYIRARSVMAVYT